MSLPRAYVPAAGAIRGAIELPVDEAHHLTRVLRIAVGAHVIVFDGAGGEWLARVETADRGHVGLSLVEQRQPVAEPVIAVTLAVGLLKGDQMNQVIRDATALGVVAIQPFVSAHVAVPARAWSRRPAERWERIAVASAKQCGRAVVPAIREIVPFSDVVAAADQADLLLCVEPSLAIGSESSAARGADAIVLCVGPEGGWAETEVDEARARGAVFVSLGPRTLRAEIAPAVALASLWTRRGW